MNRNGYPVFTGQIDSGYQSHSGQLLDGIAPAEESLPVFGEQAPSEPTLSEVDDTAIEIAAKDIKQHTTEPAIDRVAANVRQQPEPSRGYWGPYARALGEKDLETLRSMKAIADVEARAKAPEERTGFDLYVLGMSRDVPADVQAPAGSYLTPYGYYKDTGIRIAESLREGRVPEGFEDPKVLERAAALLVEDGLADFGTHPDSFSNELVAAADILRHATARVAGFNPAEAGLHQLYGRMISFAGILRAESGNHTISRGGRETGDTAPITVNKTLRAVEETMATLQLQGRQEVLAS